MEEDHDHYCNPRGVKWCIPCESRRNSRRLARPLPLWNVAMTYLELTVVSTQNRPSRSALAVRFFQPFQSHVRSLHSGHFFRPLHAFPLSDVFLTSPATHAEITTQLASRDTGIFDFFSHCQSPLVTPD